MSDRLTRGLDVAVGSLYADGEGRPSLVYDLMEPLRPVLDGQVLGWAAGVRWRRADFVVTTAPSTASFPRRFSAASLKPGVEVALVDQDVEFFGMSSLLALIIIYQAEKQLKRKSPFRETGLK